MIPSTAPGMNTVKQNSERRIPRKSSEYWRLFPRANLVLHRRQSRLNPKQIAKKRCFLGTSVWALANCEWRAEAEGFNES